MPHVTCFIFFFPENDCEREIEDDLDKGQAEGNKGLRPVHMLSFKFSINAQPTMSC